MRTQIIQCLRFSKLNALRIAGKTRLEDPGYNAALALLPVETEAGTLVDNLTTAVLFHRNSLRVLFRRPYHIAPHHLNVSSFTNPFFHLNQEKIHPGRCLLLSACLPRVLISSFDISLNAYKSHLP